MKKLCLVLCCLLTAVLLTACGCGHQNTARINELAAGCATDGYTGDVVCSDCNEVVTTGKSIPATGHLPGSRTNVKDPDCETVGYTGDIRCATCGETLESGEEIPAPGHITGEPVNAQEATCEHGGYSGDSYCTVCGETVPGQDLPALAHNYADNRCTMCGWYEAGFYKDGQMVMSWEDLKANGFVTVKDGWLRGLQGNLKGMLVVGEDVTNIPNSSMQLLGLEVVYLPASVKQLGTYLFTYTFWTEEEQTLREVYLYCGADELSSNAFNGSAKLEKVVLPDTMTQINNEAFRECTALKEVHLPAQLELIQSEAFYGAGIEEIVLPEGLVQINLRAFARSSLKRIALPASVEKIDAELFASCEQLQEVDMSACEKITELEYGLFRGCTNLKTVKLPPHLKSFHYGYDTFGGNEEMKTLTKLVLPDGFNDLGRERFDALSVETLVWPVSLVDGTNLVGAKGTIGRILYRGTAAQWSMVQGSDELTHIPVTFEYAGE